MDNIKHLGDGQGNHITEVEEIKALIPQLYET